MPVAYANRYNWMCGRTQQKAATINLLACPSYHLYVQLLWYPMYYPGGMKARVSPVQWSKPHSILPPLRIRTRAAGFRIISGDHYTTTAHWWGIWYIIISIIIQILLGSLMEYITWHTRPEPRGHPWQRAADGGPHLTAMSFLFFPAASFARDSPLSLLRNRSS